MLLWAICLFKIMLLSRAWAGNGKAENVHGQLSIYGPGIWYGEKTTWITEPPDYEGFVLSSKDVPKQQRGTSCKRKTRQKRPGKFQHCWVQKKMPDSRKMRGNLSSTFSTNNIQYWKSCKKDSSGEDMKLQCLNSHLCLREGSGFGIVWLKRSAAKFQAKGWTPQWYLYFLWDTHVESKWQAQWAAHTNWHKKGTACDSHASWPR